jgi:hypothetical protein
LPEGGCPYQKSKVPHLTNAFLGCIFTAVYSTENRSQNMTTQTPVPDFWLVKIDETEFWCDYIKSRVKKVWSVYLVDVAQHTFCCEPTPSYWLTFVESYADYLKSSDETEQDKLSEEIKEAANADEQGMYVRVSDFTKKSPLDRLPRNRKFHISRKGKREEEVQYAREARRYFKRTGETQEEEYRGLCESILEYVHSNQLL